MSSPIVVIEEGVRYIHSPAKLDRVHREIGKLWDKRMMPANIRSSAYRLKHVVDECLKRRIATKDVVVKIWREFHGKFGFGYRIPTMTLQPGSMKPVSSCDHTWLNHHGIGVESGGKAELFKRIINHPNNQGSSCTTL